MSIFKEENWSKKQAVSALILIMIISGIFGFIYETFFYRIDLGYFVKRGSTFGPWLPIYAFGGLLISLISYRFKEKPALVFVINCFVTGLLEYVTGFSLYEFLGVRLWDYNTEIWNWGNINGYICARSVLFFGISSLFLIYGIIPILKKIVAHISENKLVCISEIFGSLFVLDILLYAIIIGIG